MRPKNQEFRGLMFELVQLFKPEVYVEVGVQKGYTFNHLAPHVGRAVAVDIQIQKSITRLPNVEVYEMESIKFVSQWKTPIDMLFIDADHREESVLKDFHILLPHMRMGSGIVMLHDTHPMSEDLTSDRFCSTAWRAAERIRDKSKEIGVEIVTLPGPAYGLSIVRVLGPHYLSWR